MIRALASGALVTLEIICIGIYVAGVICGGLAFGGVL